VTEDRAEIDTRHGKASADLRELQHSAITKRDLSNTSKIVFFKLVFFPILTCGDEPQVMIKRVLLQV